MTKQKRWVLLKHTCDPRDSRGIHFDLLLEERNGCRTWRLLEIPVIDGPDVQASIAPIHKLQWLEREEAKVSGDRGWAQRVKNGIYKGCLPISNKTPFCIELHIQKEITWLTMENGLCRIRSDYVKVFDS